MTQEELPEQQEQAFYEGDTVRAIANGTDYARYSNRDRIYYQPLLYVYTKGDIGIVTKVRSNTSMNVTFDYDGVERIGCSSANFELVPNTCTDTSWGVRDRRNA